MVPFTKVHGVQPTTITPASLQFPSQAVQTPSPPILPPSTSTMDIDAPIPSVQSRPNKRYVRPRATTDEEKHTRAEERRLANRNAAKNSRERQKQALEQAQIENDRLTQENNDLHLRLANLEARMTAEEQRRQKWGNTTTTHQPARQMSLPMKTTEQQCPSPPTTPTQQTTSPISVIQRPTSQQISPISLLGLSAQQMRVMMFVMRMLMHSFALSVAFRMPWNPHFLANLHSSLQTRLERNKRQLPFSSTGRRHPGYATPNLSDLSGAPGLRLLRRDRAKAFVQPARRVMAKELQRRIRKESRGRKGICIRLIVKKKSGKRMKKR